MSELSEIRIGGPVSAGGRRQPYLGSELLSNPKVVLRLLQLVYSESGAHKVQRMSAALAYFTIFSLAPILFIAIAIAGLAFGQKAAQGAIMNQIQGFAGADGARAVQAMIQSAYKPAQSVVASLVGVVLLLIGAGGVFAEIQDALNTIWEVRSQDKKGLWNVVKARGLSFSMILIIGFLLLVSLVLSAALAGLANYVKTLFPIPAIFLYMGDVLVSLLVTSGLFAMMFKILPDVSVAWSDVWVGAGMTALLFTVGKFIIGFYIGKTISASSFGAAGSLVLIVSWIYYSSFVLYFGAEFTRMYANRFGSLMEQRTVGDQPFH